MYCPKCSAYTGADAARYCRSCGFRLDIVALLMTYNGEPQSFAPAIISPPTPTIISPRKKGLRSGGKILFSSLVMLPFVFAWALGMRNEALLLIPATVGFLGVMRMLYAWLFEDSIPAPHVAMPPAPAPAYRPVPTIPNAYQPPVVRTEVPNTSNVNQPSSVTEPTTSLLGRQ
ncbi:MAG TPA: hypothetical protein VJ810_27280 [Blastocatellia bacterium]|nr:hypothetical protein [Blastocatellia bacterium]